MSQVPSGLAGSPWDTSCCSLFSSCDARGWAGVLLEGLVLREKPFPTEICSYLFLVHKSHPCLTP